VLIPIACREGVRGRVADREAAALLASGPQHARAPAPLTLAATIAQSGEVNPLLEADPGCPRSSCPRSES